MAELFLCVHACAGGRELARASVLVVALIGAFLRPDPHCCIAAPILRRILVAHRQVGMLDNFLPAAVVLLVRNPAVMRDQSAIRARSERTSVALGVERTH